MNKCPSSKGNYFAYIYSYLLGYRSLLFSTEVAGLPNRPKLCSRQSWSLSAALCITQARSHISPARDQGISPGTSSRGHRHCWLCPQLMSISNACMLDSLLCSGPSLETPKSYPSQLAYRGWLAVVKATGPSALIKPVDTARGIFNSWGTRRKRGWQSPEGLVSSTINLGR